MSSGFVTESEIKEARRVRQEEWEKVRNADDQIEAPEEPYDGRSLFERLKEQKDKKENDYEEAHKLKNMIRGLDDDEIGFLDFIDQTKMKAERRQQLEEENEMEEFRKKVASLQEKSIDAKIQAEIASAKPKATTSNRMSQKAILSGLVKKRKASESADDVLVVAKKIDTTLKAQDKEGQVNASSQIKKQQPPVINCIGILPGIGDQYDDSSSNSENSSSEDEVACSSAAQYDLLGRKIGCKEGGC